MTTNENSGPKRVAKPPVFLVGSRPSFLDILGSHPSLLKGRTDEKEEDRPETKGAPPEADPLSQHTIRLQRFAKWSMAATLVSILCMVWVAWSIYELHDFALRQAKSVSDSIEISRLAILAANAISASDVAGRMCEPKFFPCRKNAASAPTAAAVSTVTIDEPAAGGRHRSAEATKIATAHTPGLSKNGAHALWLGR